jgi:hypothetical protein
MISQMKALEDENRRLKRMYADLSMQVDLLKEAFEKNDAAIHCPEGKWLHLPLVNARALWADCRAIALPGNRWPRLRWRGEGSPSRRPARCALGHAREGGFGVSESCYRYSPQLGGENEEIADLLIGLTNAWKTWGFGLCFFVSAQRSGARLEPQKGLPDHRGARIELEGQTLQKVESGQARCAGGRKRAKPGPINRCRQAMQGITERGLHGRSPWPLSAN